MPFSNYINIDKKYSFYEECNVKKKLPAGAYRIFNSMQGPYLKEEKLVTEDLFKIPNSPAGDLIDRINKFLQPEVKKKFIDHGLIYKRGILMYGPPGTGKTSVTFQIIKAAIEQQDMIVLLNPDPDTFQTIVKNIQEIEGSVRSFLVVWEEFEDWLSGYESEILSLLDGVDQVNNVIYIATTNCIEEIPNRIRNRPSRFADVVEIGYPDAETRRLFLKGKAEQMNILSQMDINHWVELTEGMVIDHLKDLIISVFVLDLSLEESVAKLKEIGEEFGTDTSKKNNDD